MYSDSKEKFQNIAFIRKWIQSAIRTGGILLTQIIAKEVFVKHIDVEYLDNRCSNQSQSYPILHWNRPWTRKGGQSRELVCLPRDNLFGPSFRNLIQTRRAPGKTRIFPCGPKRVERQGQTIHARLPRSWTGIVFGASIDFNLTFFMSYNSQLASSETPNIKFTCFIQQHLSAPSQIPNIISLSTLLYPATHRAEKPI